MSPINVLDPKQVGVFSSIIPKDHLTNTDLKNHKLLAVQKLLEAAIRGGIGGDGSALAVRDAQNILDFGTAADQWNTAALAVVGTAYSCFQLIAAPVLAQQKVAAFYGAAVETTPMPVSLLTFRAAGAAGTPRYVFDLEKLTTAQNPEGFFSEVVAYEKGTPVVAQVVCRIATGAAGRVRLDGYIAEPKGDTVNG